MSKLRLILQGVIFLVTVKDHASGKDQLWLLLLDPGYKTAIHHQARLYVNKDFKDDSSRDFDGTDAAHGDYFDLAGNNLTLLAGSPQPPALFFAKNTRVKKKPCFDCGNVFTFRQQKDDIQWVNTLSEILKDIPRKGSYTFEQATKLRDDITAIKYATDGLILARVFVEQGEVRTYTLWKENYDPENYDPAKISTFAFTKPLVTCDPKTDPDVSVAETVAIELTFADKITFVSRSLADGKPLSKNIVLKGKPNVWMEVRLASMRHEVAEYDFNAFYATLEHPEYFEYLPLPAKCVGPDSGGACSPARP
jgi:hypothetical protein